MAELTPAIKHTPEQARGSQAGPQAGRAVDAESAPSPPGLANAQFAASAAPGGARPPVPPLPPWQLLRLQSSAGNHAIAEVLSRQYQRTTVQRSAGPLRTSAPLAHDFSEQPSAAEPEVSTVARAEVPHAAEPVAPLVMRSTVVQRSIGDAILGKVADWAKEIPGYPLLTVILGKDPISGATVERNAMNVVHGILSIVPGGNKIFENLQQSGALERFFDWVNGEIPKLGLSFESIKQLFSNAWHALSVTDLLDPLGAWNKVKGIFGPTLGRIKDFAIDAGKKVLEFILEGVLKLAGPLGEQVMAMLKKGADVFNKIVQDPIGFLGNLLTAV